MFVEMQLRKTGWTGTENLFNIYLSIVVRTVVKADWNL